jgi:hypothetical protein
MWHEEMHERAGQKEEEWQSSSQMSLMPRKKQNAHNQEKAQQNKGISPAPPGRMKLIVHGEGSCFPG